MKYGERQKERERKEGATHRIATKRQKFREYDQLSGNNKIWNASLVNLLSRVDDKMIGARCSATHVSGGRLHSSSFANICEPQTSLLGGAHRRIDGSISKRIDYT